MTDIPFEFSPQYIFVTLCIKDVFQVFKLGALPSDYGSAGRHDMATVRIRREWLSARIHNGLLLIGRILEVVIVGISGGLWLLLRQVVVGLGLEPQRRRLLVVDVVGGRQGHHIWGEEHVRALTRTGIGEWRGCGGGCWWCWASSPAAVVDVHGSSGRSRSRGRIARRAVGRWWHDRKTCKAAEIVELIIIRGITQS